MFHAIPDAIAARMRFLEERDAQDREDGTPRLRRLRQIPPETGRFIALLAASAPEGRFIEIGTSAGYSALWIALACRLRGQRLTTFEVLEEKVALATQTFAAARVEDTVTLVAADALSQIAGLDGISFCFLDAEKEVYRDCYEAVVPRMVPGGLLAADNALSHGDALAPMLDRALADERVNALIVPVGKGVLLCRALE